MTKVSIIVPVYNTERTVEKCIQSIQKQSYNNIEIVLVDDGSPDNAPAICEEYAKRDTRIVCCHKKNGGLSDARNFGIMRATGDYIGFVDSDDYVAPDMYEKLLETAVKNAADIVNCGFFLVENGKIVQKRYCDCCIKKMTGLQAVEALIDQRETTNFAWNKLYKKSLFDEIQFPVGKVYEDLLTTYRLYSKCNTVCNLNEPLYYYMINPSGITHNPTHIYDLWKAQVKQHGDILQLLPDAQETRSKAYDELAKKTVADVKELLKADQELSKEPLAAILSYVKADPELRKRLARFLLFPRTYCRLYDIRIWGGSFRRKIKDDLTKIMKE